MKNTLYTLLALTIGSFVFGQVGVNTSNPQGIFNIDGKKDNPATGSAHTAEQQLNDVTVLNNGNVGIGTINPTQKLEIQTGGTPTAPVTGFKLADGTQYEDYVLTSDANGVGTWQPITLKIVTGHNGSGIDMTFTPTSEYKYTGSYIDLPPGKWQVTIYQLLNPRGDDHLTADQWMFVRSTFSDESGLSLGDITTKSDDITSNPTLISFLIQGPSSFGVAGDGSSQNRRYSIVNGTLVINNQSTASKRYYYIAGNNVVGGTQTTQTFLRRIGGNWSENLIYAIQIAD